MVVVTDNGPLVPIALPVVELGLAIETKKSSLPSTTASSIVVNSIQRSPIGLPSLVNVKNVPSKESVPGPV